MKTITVRKALNDALDEEMERDNRIFMLGEEIGEYQGAYKVSQGLLAKYGSERIIDTPITEHAFTGLAVGAALNGLLPIVEFMTFNFAMQAIDQIINSAAKIHYMSGGLVKCPLVLRGPNGIASRTAAQHSQCFASWYSHIPGLKVIAPYFADDFRGLLKSAIRDPNPIIFLESELLYAEEHEVPEHTLSKDYLVNIGEAKIFKVGKDLTVISFSRAMRVIIEAATILSTHNIDLEIIDIRTIRPLDISTIVKSVKKTGRLMIVEDGWSFAGIASEIAMQVMENAFDYLDAPIARITGKDVPMPYAANLEAATIPQTNDVLETAKNLFYRKI